MDKPEPLIPNELLPLPDPDVIDIGRFGLCWHEEGVLAYGRQVAARYEARIAELERSRDELVQKMHQLERERDALRADAQRYRWLRGRDLNTITAGGVFAGMTPQNVVINGADLDARIDVERAAQGSADA